MTNIDTVFLYIFILSILINLSFILKLINAIISTPPKRFTLSVKELYLIGMSLSYIITYFIKN